MLPKPMLMSPSLAIGANELRTTSTSSPIDEIQLSPEDSQSSIGFAHSERRMRTGPTPFDASPENLVHGIPQPERARYNREFDQATPADYRQLELPLVQRSGGVQMIGAGGLPSIKLNIDY